jgi:protein TonB
MRAAGILLSGLGHAALIWVAVHGPPWLRPHRERPPPVIAVSLLTDAELAALAPRPAPTSPAPAPAPEPSPAAPPAPEPELEPPVAEEPASLAPAFDPAAPLGLAGDGAALRPADRPRPRRGDAPAREAAVAPWSGEAAALRSRYEEAVRTAVERARSYPEVARARGLEGSVRLHLILTREGRLLAAQLVRSSGAQTLDRAGLAAARDARLPAAPPELPNERFSFEVEVRFAGSDR